MTLSLRTDWLSFKIFFLEQTCARTLSIWLLSVEYAVEVVEKLSLVVVGEETEAGVVGVLLVLLVRAVAYE